MEQQEALKRLKELASRRKLGHFARWSGVSYQTLQGITASKKERVISPANMAKIARGFERLASSGEAYAFITSRPTPELLAIELEEWPFGVEYFYASSKREVIGFNPMAPAARLKTMNTVHPCWLSHNAGTAPRVYRQQWQEVRAALGFN